MTATGAALVLDPGGFPVGPAPCTPAGSVLEAGMSSRLGHWSPGPGSSWRRCAGDPGYVHLRELMAQQFLAGLRPGSGAPALQGAPVEPGCSCSYGGIGLEAACSGSQRNLAPRVRRVRRGRRAPPRSTRRPAVADGLGRRDRSPGSCSTSRAQMASAGSPRSHRPARSLTILPGFAP